MRSDDEDFLYIGLRPHSTQDMGWLRHAWSTNYRTARMRHICWRPQHEHATVDENKTPITGKVYPHLTASPEVHTKRSLTVSHACVSGTFAENTPQLSFHFRGHSEADCSELCSPEARDNPTLWGVDDDGNECFLWNSSMAESNDFVDPRYACSTYCLVSFS